ncbi:hypothetical protein Ddye_013531 [Dipteronia dyeriana]|uniref:Uncharacterized protein n=1 Tax=Dipteronia dyeriana TaxID=168575 RepID=A0AAD9X6G7_9ROSI|nr:hypothetical protein Ddye_013531 [Dipteronia dyeriana]
MISSQASSSTAPSTVPPPSTLPPEFLATLPPGQVPSVQQNPTSPNLQTFLQWFNPLSVWRTELTKLMSQYHLWKMDPEPASKVCCIWIFNRPYRYNPLAQLLWTSNVNCKWDTSYDYERLYHPSIQIPLLNFLCDVNHDRT